MTFLFTSESVSEGHPDKICDQISDAILDATLKEDPNSRVAAECFATTGMVLIGGEITTKATLNVEQIARDVIKDIGYDDASKGLDYKSCAVLSTLNEQSEDIAQGVNEGEGLHKELGAGDQGMMIGFACNQTPELMPLPVSLSHKLVHRLSQLRKSGQLGYLRPDAKSQVTIEYNEDGSPLRVEAVVVSTQHDPDVDHKTIESDMINVLIADVIPSELLDKNTKYYINPTGRFVIGGPQGDAGLTGRKIIVDTYGGWACHGGGAFSGKDATKVDRSGAYMARYVAKNIVAAGLADSIEIQLAYAIGVSDPLSIHIDTRGTGRISDSQIVEVIRKHFDLSAAGIIRELDLQRPIYRPTAAYGHFGRSDVELPWEQTDKVSQIQADVAVATTA